MTLTVKDFFAALPDMDELLSGSPDGAVSGVAVAFVASQQVLEQAQAIGANLVLTHEGPFYSHQNRRSGLESDPVYEKKTEWLARSGIHLCRYHDSIHRMQPDGIMVGLLHELGWNSCVKVHESAYCILELPPMGLRAVVEHFKKRLGLPYVRVMGDPGMLCRKIGLAVGYRGGGPNAIPLYHREEVDLVVAGEGPEWETPEYVRDALYQGRSKALIMLGHAESEMAGMRHLAAWLSDRFPELPVTFIPNEPLFRVE